MGTILRLNGQEFIDNCWIKQYVAGNERILRLCFNESTRPSMDYEAAKVGLENILGKCKERKIDFTNLGAVKKNIKKQANGKILFVAFGAFFIFSVSAIWTYINQGDCLLEMPVALSKAFRPPESCKFCIGISGVRRLSNVTPREFEESFAYSGEPVIITDATKNWTALEAFDFWYFKEVYLNAKRKHKALSCQFFPYKTGVKNLYEALSIPTERVTYEKGTSPWYFGWSNCNNEVAEILRLHYGRPYFLPETSENNAVDWIFMGGPGMGVQMHVDNVRLPSWQAQLKGSKKWILAPPPECYFYCSQLETIVEKGQIIVLDTNKWYHQTIVTSGEISVTIGAEYD